jgi:hypothetical protein
MRGRPKSRLGHGLAAQPGGKDGMRGPWQRARVPRVRWRAGRQRGRGWPVARCYRQAPVGSWGGARQEDRRQGSPNRRRGTVAINGDGAGTMVADDGALALPHGEGKSEVRWGRD